MRDRSIACLPDRGLVEVQGTDTASFLHNLVTNDVVSTKLGTAVFAGLLTSKGIIIFDFLIYRRGEDDFLIDCLKSQAEELAKRLMLYKLRAKITVTNRSEDWQVGACWGDDVDWPSQTGLQSYADPRYAAMGRRFIAPRDFAWPGPACVTASAYEDYHRHRIALGVPEGGRDYVYGETFPHDACYDALHGVDYKKGCYVGQEVVSRMHHKGTAKTQIAVIESAAMLPEEGAEIHAGEIPAGRLGSVDGMRGIARLRMDRVADAQEKGLPIRAGGVDLLVKSPPWLKTRNEAGGTT